jgi:hypothetical protein
MGTTLTGLTPATTYDALIKVGDNGPLSATAKYVGDGLGNDSVVALSTSSVGIGTTSPTQLLHVAGNVRITGALYDGNNAAGTSGQILSSTGTATDWVSKSDLGLVDGSGTANFVSKWSDTDTLTNSLIFDNGTNIGIGTTSPSYQLDLQGGTTNNSRIRLLRGTDDASQFMVLGFSNISLHRNVSLASPQTDLSINQVGSDGTRTPFYISSAGNVGIGTTAPASTLDVVGTLAVSSTGLFVGDLRTNGNFSVGNTSVAGVKVAQIYPSATSTPAIIQGVHAGVGPYDLAFQTSGGNVGIGTASPASKLDVNGDIATSGDIILTGAKGIYFDNAASKYLDDYEQGTWTMGVSFGGASVGVTTSQNTGTYTKIGRQVTVNGYLQLTSKGSSAGIAIITGLPFALANNAANYSAASLRLNDIVFTNQFQGFGDIGQTYIVLNEITNLGVSSSLTAADFTNDSAVILSLTYFV